MYKKTIFPNGVRLIQIPFKDTKAVTILFLFGVGSRYEHQRISGAAHFIEHLMFKGTKKRPTALHITRDLDNVGAEFNAMTSKDYTGYYIKIDRAKQKLAVDVLCDILLNSKFENREMNRERGVIAEEIKMYEDNPLMYIDNLFEQSVFFAHPLGRDISGSISVITKISRKQLLDFKTKFYCPNNLVIAIAGQISRELIESIKQSYINKQKVQAEKSDLNFIKFDSLQTAPRVRLKFSSTKQAQLSVGFPACGYDDPRAYALHLLSIILGGNMSSRLFLSVREKRGLCYFVRCYPNFYQDTGNLMIQSGLDISRFDKALDVIQRELRKIKTKLVSKKELSSAREFLRGKVVLNLEDSSNLAEYYAKQELLVGKIMTPEQKMKQYEAVSRADILKLAKEIIRLEKFNLAAIGPFKSKEKIYRQIKI